MYSDILYSFKPCVCVNFRFLLAVFAGASSTVLATPYMLLALGVLLFIFTLWAAILGCIAQVSYMSFLKFE